MKLNIKLLATLIIGLGLIFNPVLVLTETSSNSAEITDLNKEIEARKSRIKQLEETMSNYQKNIASKHLEAVSLKNQLSILDNHITQVEMDIELLNEKIAEIELEIAGLELSIKDKELVIAKQRKIIIKIIQSINAEDQKNYVEIVLSNDNFADFYDQVKYLENVYTDLGQSIKKLRISKEDLQFKKSLVDQQRIKYSDLKQQLEERKNDLKDQTNVKQNLLVETKSSEIKYQTLLTSLRSQYQVIEGEVRTYEDKIRKKLEDQQKLSETGSMSFFWPVTSHYITATFHDPDYPYRKVFEHSGIDIRASQGTPIKAAGSGYVARAKRCTVSSCYSYTLIVHTGNLSTLYGHMSSISVSEDQFVNKGDVIGYSGGTPGTVGAGPFVTGAHLHFEVRANGIPVDPMGYLIQ